MSSTQQNVTQGEQAGTRAVGAQRSDAPLRPSIDVFETTEGITLHADMPGVSREHLKLQIESNTLTLEGELQLRMSGPMEALYADVRSMLYRRSFALSPELEGSRIEANLKDGVLTVRIPKRAELRPRRIEVQSG